MADHSTTSARQVNWWLVHEWVSPALNAAQSWPMAGTPAWAALDDSDLRKLVAVLDGGRHWALRIDTVQGALRDASREVCASADWSAISRTMTRHRSVYVPRRTP